MVKTVKLWSHTWLKNDSKECGAMKQAIDEKTDGDIICHSLTHKNGKVWSHIQPQECLNLLSKNYGLYEVITTYHHKLYFEIDIRTTYRKGK